MNTQRKTLFLLAVCAFTIQQAQAVSEDTVPAGGCAAGIIAGLLSGIAITTITEKCSAPVRYGSLFLGCATACAAANLTVSALLAELTPYGRVSRVHQIIQKLEQDNIIKQLNSNHKLIHPSKAVSLKLEKLHTIALAARTSLEWAHKEAVENNYPHGLIRHCKQLIEHLSIIIEKIAHVQQSTLIPCD